MPICNPGIQPNHAHSYQGHVDIMTNKLWAIINILYQPEWMPDELNERLNNPIEMEETEIVPEPLNQIVFRIVSDIDIFDFLSFCSHRLDASGYQ